MRTITNCHFGVIINGVSNGFILSEHGLRQGDPFSPTLFILASEYLSRGINALFAQYPSMFCDTKKGVNVLHLAFVDDLIIFTKALQN